MAGHEETSIPGILNESRISRENVPQNDVPVPSNTLSKDGNAMGNVKKRKHSDNENPQSVKKRKDIFKFGNYNRYYGYRNIHESPKEDVRLQAFIEQKNLITNKRLLDIGCNNGTLTLLIAKHCNPASVVGIDIDRNLIGHARKHLIFMLRSCMHDDDAVRSLKCVEFKTANYAYRDESLLVNEKPQFDVILCLSVTKWIHLNFGDAAVKLSFNRAYRQLNDGGIFILEAQPWSSYKNKKKLTEEIFENFKKIAFRPDEFNRFLLEEVGFREMVELNVVDHKVKGFRRPIFVFRK